MRIRGLLITVAFLASALWGCGMGNAGSDSSSADDLSAFPQLVSSDYDLSKYDDNNSMYFECYGNTWSLTEDSAGVYPKLVSSLKKSMNTRKNISKKTLSPQYIYSFNPNSLTFYFNPAVLSPYSDGGEQINLTYEDLSTVLNKKYAQP